MRVQILGLERKNYSSPYELVFNQLSNPQNFSDFDVNIIDLQYADIWNYFSDYYKIKHKNDIESLIKLIRCHDKPIVIVLPINYTINHNVKLKDFITELSGVITNYFSFENLGINLVYENIETICGESVFPASFSISGFAYETLTEATGNRTTSILVKENCILTTLNLAQKDTNLQDYFIAVGLDESKKRVIPQWVKDIECFDDKEQKNAIQERNKTIEQLKAEIISAEEKLKINNYYKSVLYENGNNLVKVVFDILEKILDYDLKSFKDEFREDFAIKLDDITFIGEIKGINTNVKSANITQVVNHLKNYEDGLQESGTEETTKAILIVNSFRDRSLSDREPIHDKQIKDASLYSCLVILTKDLLTLFEMFESGLVNVEKIRKSLKEQIGLFDIESLK